MAFLVIIFLAMVFFIIFLVKLFSVSIFWVIIFLELPSSKLFFLPFLPTSSFTILLL